MQLILIVWSQKIIIESVYSWGTYLCVFGIHSELFIDSIESRMKMQH